MKADMSNNFEDTILWGAMCLGFFGFLRACEFTADSHFDPDKNLSREDISNDSHSQPSLMRVLIKRSKTDQYGSGAYIFLARIDSDICPVAAILAYLAVRPSVPGPLFIYEDGSYLSRSKLIQSLNHALPSAGIDPSFYKGHSFRIGAATTASALGIQDSLIQKNGKMVQ